MANPIQRVSRNLQVLRTEGMAATLRRISLRFFPPRASRHPFDIQNQVDTAGVLRASALITGHPNDSHTTAYWGSAPSLFRGALARWQQDLAGTHRALADYTFIDLGAGKGRALLLASELPFDRIVGVELSPVLTSIAQRNIARWLRTPRACNCIQALHADALAVPLPDSPVLLYLFNPFDAVLTQRLAHRLQALAPNRSHPIDILYLRPDHAAILERIPGIQTLFKEYISFSPEDTAADPSATRRHEVYLYRIPPGLPNR
jgi:SAM-dependent methyltransferase